MVADTTACRTAQAVESSVLDDAVTVWVVLEAAAAFPNTPEGRTNNALAKDRFMEWVTQAGLDEEMLRARLVARRQRPVQAVIRPTERSLLELVRSYEPKPPDHG